jgi:NTP pyrophosphatase (non-canonical NTP hydrolase)
MITQEQKIDLNKYAEFVDQTTSYPSKSNEEFIRRIENLNENGVNIARLMTAAVGMSAEAGEFTEIVKKIAFQGKELTIDNHEHMVKELGDVFWYFTQALLGLGVDVQTVVLKNMIKLTERYPEGAFDVYFSENRKEGDI